MGSKIISNRSLFNIYSSIRIIAIFLFVSFFVFKGMGIKIIGNDSTLEIIFIAIILTILLFDFFQKPSYIELLECKEKLILKLFIPNKNYFFFLAERFIRRIEIDKDETISFHIYKGVISTFDEIEFVIKKKDSVLIKTERINAAWLSSSQVKKLERIIEKY